MRPMLLMLTAAALFACDREPQESPSAGFEGDLEALKEYFHIPGMAAIVTQRGEVVYENYFGYADLATERPVDSTTIFPVGSITKTFAAVLLMQLAEAGDLDLNDPINDYLADSQLSDSITILHILSQTSEGTPGSFFNYGTPRFTLLTEVLETASGKSLAHLLDDNILQPQGLHNTLPIVSHANVDSLSDILAKPYAYYGEIEDGRYDIGFAAGYGVASTLRDLAKFAQSLGSGALIADSNTRKMFSPFPTSTGISPYGLGIFSQAFLGKQIVWGYGQEEYFSGLVLRVPEDDITLVLLANNKLMSDPARLINGDLTYSLFALSFLKHFVLDVPTHIDWMNVDFHEALDVPSVQGDYGPFYRQEMLANAIAGTIMWRTDSTAVRRSKDFVALAFEQFPDYAGYGNQSLMLLLSYLSTQGVRDCDDAMENVGATLLGANPLDPYVNESLGDHYKHLGETEKAFEYFETIAESDNFNPNWYTIEALDFLGDYYKQENPELAKDYFQRVVDIGWNMGGLLDKAKQELEGF